MEAGKERLTRDSVLDATRQEIEQLRRENSEMKELVGELFLELHRFKKQLCHHYTTTASAHERSGTIEGHG